MASTLISTAFVAAVLSNAGARGFETIDLAFGKSFTSNVTAERLFATPTWDEAEDNPPISARAALQAARAMRDSVVMPPDGFSWNRGSLTLMQPGEQCYWLAHFMAKKDGDNEKHRLTIIVLMDGTAVKPVVEQAAAGKNSRISN